MIEATTPVRDKEKGINNATFGAVVGPVTVVVVYLEFATYGVRC